MYTANLTIEQLDDEYSEFCLDHNLDDERIANARLAPGLRRWLRDFDARREAACELAPLAEKALITEEGTEEFERALDLFAYAVKPYMTIYQFGEWQRKVMPSELIVEAFRILGIPSPIGRIQKESQT